jgi:hypothetical protein
MKPLRLLSNAQDPYSPPISVRERTTITVKLGKKRADGRWTTTKAVEVTGRETCNEHLFVIRSLAESQGPYSLVHKEGWTVFCRIPDVRTAELLAGAISSNLDDPRVGSDPRVGTDHPELMFAFGTNDPWYVTQQFRKLPTPLKNWMRLWF